MHNQNILAMSYCHTKFQRYSFGDFFYEECDGGLNTFTCYLNQYIVYEQHSKGEFVKDDRLGWSDTITGVYQL